MHPGLDPLHFRSADLLVVRADSAASWVDLAGIEAAILAGFGIVAEFEELSWAASPSVQKTWRKKPMPLPKPE